LKLKEQKRRAAATMKFIVSTKKVPLRETKKPCDEAREQELTPLDFRDVRTLEEAKGKIWYNDWIESGKNHREENGMIVCDKKIPMKQWIVDISSLEALLEFQKKHGDIVISDSSPFKEASHEIILQGIGNK
jgi:hypothetical protein